ncbi:hypothetical protein AMST5_01644 [freshwater sediment metagenome]|uniref:Uncharacterized protein n=1 Tax=freshwater sediment metagenome TaxID=556182 RepID=A0AA48M0H3_9ZZZZ
MVPSQPAPEPERPTVAQLRRAIDRGAARDKIDFPDPAIAPLGADAEAGGAPPTIGEISEAMRQRVASSGGAQSAQEPYRDGRERERVDGGPVLPWRSLIFGALCFGLAGGALVTLRFG